MNMPIGYSPYPPPTLGTVANDVAGFFGLSGGGLGITLDALVGNDIGVIQNMRDKWMEAAYGPTNSYQRGINEGRSFAPYMMVPGPWAAYGNSMRYAMPGYAPGMMMPGMAPGMMPGAGVMGQEVEIDLAPPGTTNFPFVRMFDGNRTKAAEYERKLQSDPVERERFERAIGGRIVDFGFLADGLFADGKIKIQRFAPGAGNFPNIGMSPYAYNAFGFMNGMNQTAMAAMGPMGMGNPYGAFVGAGMMNMLNPMMGGGYLPNGWGNATPYGGMGMGSWNPNAVPGTVNNTNPLYEQAHQMEINGVLSDPSLTIEDKVTLMIMLIMKKMDDDILNQAQYINSLQAQQGRRPADAASGVGAYGAMDAFGMPIYPGMPGYNGIPGGPGTLNGTAGGVDAGDKASSSIDIETMKLKRMIDKRSQMFDMLRQIIDKYNQTAKGIIDSMGR